MNGISVVVPSYRRPAKLRRAIDALRLADPPPLEVLIAVVDPLDAALGQGEAESADRFRVVVAGQKGAAAQRNAGWRAARGGIVAFTDDDCAAEPAWLGALARGFSDPTVGLVQGVTLPLGPTDPLSRTIRVVSETGLYESCNIAYRREALEEAGGFDESFSQRFSGRPFGEDVDLAWRVKRAGWSSAFAAEAVVRHEVVKGGIRDLVAEEWRRGMFPALVAHVPELRALLPGGGRLLRPQSAWAQLAVAGAVLTPARPRIGVALMAPYAAWLARSTALRGVPYQALRDAVASVALLAGSVRARSLLL